MSLLRLLSAAKSLDGSKPTESPYRMRAANRLPKFGSAKNPFAREPKAEPSKNDPGSTDATPTTGSLFDEKPVSALAPFRKPAPVKESKPPVAATPKEEKAEPKPESPAPATKEKKSGTIGGLVKKLNPLSYLPKRQPGASGARPRAARTTVQGELSLEKVQVLRNDLNDSDLEFVAAKPAVISTAGTMLATPRPRLTTWGRLTSRVMGEVGVQTQ